MNRVFALAMGISLGAYGCGGGAPSDEPSRAEPVPQAMATGFPVAAQVSINEVMVAVVDHASHEIWHAGIEEQAPQTDEDWKELEHHAVQIAAAGSWVSVGGNGQADPGWVKLVGWKEYTQDMTDAAALALDAARRKDLEGLLHAGDRLVESCEACHKEFKPELPSEGYIHPHFLR